MFDSSSSCCRIAPRSTRKSRFATTSRFLNSMEYCVLRRFFLHGRGCDHPHCCAHLVPLPTRETRRAGRELPDRNRSGCNRHHHREWRALSGRAGCLVHLLRQEPPRREYRLGNFRASLRAYSLPEEKIDVDGLNTSITQGIAPTLIFIRMFGLLNLPSGLLRSSGIASASRPGSTRVVLGQCTITSTGLGPLDATEMPNSEKPDDRDLGSNSNSTENTSMV